MRTYKLLTTGFHEKHNKNSRMSARSISFDKKQQLINNQELEDSFLFLDWVISVSGMAAGLKIWKGALCFVRITDMIRL